MDNLDSALQAYVIENYVDITDYKEELKDDNDTLELCIKKDLYEKLSKDAKNVIDLVLNTSIETFCAIKSPNNHRCFYVPKKKTVPNVKLIERYLRWTWGWPGNRIYRTIKEIKLFLSRL